MEGSDEEVILKLVAQREEKRIAKACATVTTVTAVATVATATTVATVTIVTHRSGMQRMRSVQN